MVEWLFGLMRLMWCLSLQGEQNSMTMNQYSLQHNYRYLYTIIVIYTLEEDLILISLLNVGGLIGGRIFLLHVLLL